MALSMEEQRQLSEIASSLREDDPRLAERLSSFGDSGRRRVLIVAAVISVLVVAVTGAVATVLVS